MGLLDEALKASDAAVALAADDPAVYVRRGRILTALGRTVDAEEDFKKALALDATGDDVVLPIARLRAATNPSAALGLVDSYLKTHPDSVEAMVNVARLREVLGDPTAAEAMWRRVTEVDPDLIDAWFALGRLAEMRDDRAAAVEAYRAARQLDPDDVDVLIPLGENLQRLGRTAEAREALDRAVGIDPLNPSARFGLALLAEADRDWSRAVENMTVAAAGSDLPAVHLQLAFEQSLAGRPRDAIKTLRHVLRMDPANAAALAYLGFAYDDLGDPRRAVKAYERALSLSDGLSEVHFRAGVCWDELRRFDRAEPHLERAVALNSSYAVALNYLGYSWADRGVRLTEAESMIKSALRLSPDNPAYLDSLGWCLFKQGRASEADSILARAVHMIDDAVVWEHYGDVLKASSRDEESIRAWQMGLLLAPDSRSLKKRLGRRASMTGMVTPLTAARTVLKRAEADFRSLRGGAGAVTMTARKGLVSVDADGVFYYRRPGDFRLEILGAFGVPEAVAVRTASGMRVVPEGADIGLPPESSSVLAALADVLSGAMTARFDDASVAVRRRGSDLTYSGSAGELTIDGRGQTVTCWSDGTSSLFLSEYKAVDGVRWPGVIRLVVADGTSVTLSFKNPKMNPALDGDLFEVK
jgi:tetratricopeptide (TPR) repeat protein